MAHTPLTRTKRILRHFEDYRAAYLASLTLVAIIVACIWLYELRNARRRDRASWPETDALIVSSKIDVRHIPDEDYLLTDLFIKVHVQFNHDGLEREASIFKFIHRNSPLDCKKLLAPGQTVRIKFDPKDPTRISLDPLLPD